MASPSAAAQQASWQVINVAEFVSEKLKNSKNYNTWKKQMARFMESQGFVGVPPPRPTEEQHYAAWKQRDGILKACILESLSDEVAQTVTNSGTASQILQELENNFTGDLVSDKLNANNYNTWKEQMLRFMESKCFVRSPAPPRTEEHDYAAWEQRDGILKAYILQSLSDEVAQTVANSGTASEIWQELENNFTGDLVSEKLNANNYNTWKEQMLRFMESKCFVRSPAPPRTEEHDYAAWEQRDGILKDYILQSLSDEVAQTVANSGTASEIWQELENNFTGEYLPLYRAAVSGNWAAAEPILDSNPGAVNARMGSTLETALHVAVSSGNSNDFVWNLMRYMSDESLAIVDIDGLNALHRAAYTGNLYATKRLAHRLPYLMYMPSKNGRFPVQLAAYSAHRETLEFLISNTRDDTFTNPFASQSGLVLLAFMIDANYFDKAQELVDKYPDLARIKYENRVSALTQIVANFIVFSTDADQFNRRERLIYSKGLPQQPILRWLVKRLVSRASWIDEEKLKREAAVRLVKRLCELLEPLSSKEAADIYRGAFFSAAKLGIHEIIEEIVDTFPNAIYEVDRNKRTFIHLAVQNRCERVFNLIYQTGNRRYLYANKLDSSGNSILHLAAASAPTHKLNLVASAALQMQRELQWFQEVSKFVSPYNRIGENNAAQTPNMIFTKTHEKLKVEGEKWMKDTANSCTIAAALITTVVFAAAITVPGGNDSASGYPMMRKSSAFTVFAVSDAISLFMSTTSLLQFLSILTSRYAEQDFLRGLPKRLYYGLLALFLSILCMMVAFGSTLYLVFGRSHVWILAPVVAFSLLPITSFLQLQYPLVRDVISSTHGRGIFGKQSDRPLY